jgi:hypothetical protein
VLLFSYTIRPGHSVQPSIATLTPLDSSDATRQGFHRTSDTSSIWAAHKGHQAHIHVTCGFRLCHPWHTGGNVAPATHHQPHHPCSGQPLRILADQRRLEVEPEISFPTSNTTPGQRHFLATGHPWPRFVASRHGLTTIRHIPVPEIRALCPPAVSGLATTLGPVPPWPDQGFNAQVGCGPFLRPVYPAGTSLRQTTPAQPSVAGQSIDITNTTLRLTGRT